MKARREQLQAELAALQDERRQREISIVNIGNITLKERFQEHIDRIIAQESQKFKK